MANEFVQTMADARVDAKSLSEFMFKPVNSMVERRLAPSMHTLNYYIDSLDRVAINGEVQINQAIINSGFIITDSFELGATLTQRNQALRHAADGKLYRWAGDLPKIVPLSSTPTSTGGLGTNAWMEVSDATLRQELYGMGGASKIGNAVSYFINLASFNVTETAIKEGASVFLYSLHQDLDLEGEGRVYTYSKTAKNGFIEIKTPLGYLSRKFDGKVFIAEQGAEGNDYAKDSAALQASFDLIRASVGGGILSMGKKCEYKIRGNLYANCSNLDWQFNNSSVVLGKTWIAWHPNKLGYGSHKNVRISDAIWVGNKSDTDTQGNIHIDAGKIDGLYVRNCTYIEALYSGHFLDLMGSRFVYFEHNIVLGSCIVTPNYARYFSEALQIGTCTLGGQGMPLTKGSSPFFDGLATTDIYMRHNIFEPYDNPTTGVRSYPPRPVGDHGVNLCKNIYVQHNTFANNISLTTEVDENKRTLIYLSGYDNIIVDDNIIVSDEYGARNTAIMTIVMLPPPVDSTYKHTPYFSAQRNDIKVKISPPEVFILKATGIKFVYYPPIEGVAQSKGRIVKTNDNDIDMDVPLGKEGGAGIEIWNRPAIDSLNNDYEINDNNITLNGGYSNHIYIIGDKRGGVENIKRNKLSGLLKGYSVISNTAFINSYIFENTFNDQWRYIYASGGRNILLNNITIGFSNTNYDGKETAETEVLGAGNPILIYTSTGTSSVYKGNMLTGETRKNPVRVDSSASARPVDEFLITAK